MDCLKYQFNCSLISCNTQRIFQVTNIYLFTKQNMIQQIWDGTHLEHNNNMKKDVIYQQNHTYNVRSFGNMTNAPGWITLILQTWRLLKHCETKLCYRCRIDFCNDLLNSHFIIPTTPPHTCFYTLIYYLK